MSTVTMYGWDMINAIWLFERDRAQQQFIIEEFGLDEIIDGAAFEYERRRRIPMKETRLVLKDYVANPEKYAEMLKEGGKSLYDGLVYPRPA